MAIEIQINPEDIDNMVRDALMKSTIGKLVESTVAAATKMGSYNSPVEDAVRQFVKQQTLEVLSTQYKETLSTAIALALGEQLTEEWFKQKADAFAGQLVRDLKERY